MTKISKTVKTVMLLTPFLATNAQERPNIIIILADDLGYSDIGCYGSEIMTPNLDALAKKGIRYTNFYNSARSCPSRASLLTGLYPHQTGMGNMVIDQGAESYSGDLNEKCVTIAQVLQQNSYGTYMTGKWHLTKHTDMFEKDLPEEKREYTSKYNWPIQRGFDKYYGTIHGAGSFFEPTTLVDGNEPVDDFEDNFYYTDVITNKTIEFINEHLTNKKEKPFFFYVSYTAPHWPLHALEEDIQKYKGVYSKGWDFIRKQRFNKQLELGIVNETYTLSDRTSDINSWEEEDKKDYYIKCMEVYAAQVDRMDQGIGKIMSFLKDKKIDDNTMILFLSDNGACAEVITEKWPMSLHMPYQTKNGNPVSRGYTDKTEIIGSNISYTSYGEGWANASNTPFRYYKHYIHEGGIATPFIISWPKKIKDQNRISRERGHLIDIMPTCLEAAKADFPKAFKGVNLTPLEGSSILSKNRDYEKLYCWEHHGNKGALQGDWKLVQANKCKWELYNIKNDRTETNNLTEKYPDIMQNLITLYESWATRVGVIDNIEKKKSKK